MRDGWLRFRGRAESCRRPAEIMQHSSWQANFAEQTTTPQISFRRTVLKNTLIGRWLRLSTICFALCLCTIVPASLLAQQAGSIAGTVLDPSGGALSKAIVVVHRVSGSVSKEATTDGQGRFSVDSLPAGTYTVEVASQGFATATRTGVQITAGQLLNISIQLAVGNVSQQITVSA